MYPVGSEVVAWRNRHNTPMPSFQYLYPLHVVNALQCDDLYMTRNTHRSSA